MNNEKKLFLKNSFLLTVAPFLPKLVNVFLLPIMTLYLTEVDFGIAGTISSYTSAISAFMTLGLTVVLQNTFFKISSDYKTIWRQIYGFLMIWMWVYAIIQSVLLYFCCPEEARVNVWWIILLANFTTVLFGPTGTIGSSYYIYNKQSWPIVWRSVVASILTILVDFVMIVYLKLGYMGWYVGTFIGQFFSNATYWYVVSKKLDLKPCYRFDMSVIKHSLAVGMPTIPHLYTGYLLEGSGRMVLDQNHINQGEIGRVSVSQQIGDICSMGIKGLSDAIGPYAMNALKNGNEVLMRRITMFYTVFVFFIVFFISLWSKELFAILLSNEQLSSSYPYFIMYLMAFCYRPLYVMVSFYYFYFERTKQLLLITFMAGIIALLFYIVFTPIYGVWAFLIGHYVACLYFGYSGYLYSGYRSNSKKRIPIGLLLVIQLLLTGAAFILVDMFIVKTIFSIITLSICIMIIVKLRNVIK